eukprot:TRINITY_DN10690_c0_g2_i1.p1 TRINITY_DN10690_c0_g2~~TRINITY_DN10690_c0_g2_i1.p1  ORF type:complete len:474 (+),score=72.62 TRINITY_DN10690_c0_g2_i1:194-1423(+)
MKEHRFLQMESDFSITRSTKVPFFEEQTNFDKEYLGSVEEEQEADYEQIVVDEEIELDPAYRYELRDAGPCPEGYSRHSAWLVGNEIWCFNPSTLNIDVFDPTDEIWSSRERVPFNFTPDHKHLLMSALDIQCDMLNRENLALWVRPTMNDHGIMMTTELGQTSLVLGDEFPAPSYWRYGRMFSLNNNLILQSRYRPVRDTMDTIMRYSMLDHDPVHKIGSEYAMESCFSSLFFFLFDRQAWVKATVSGYPLPVCSCVVKSPNEKKAYFLSRINQGYELDSRTWKVKSLHLIGRPYSLSAGSALTMTPDNCVVAVGGSWVAWSEASLQGATIDLQKGSNTVRSKPPVKEVKRKEEMPIHRFYSNRLYILDLKTKRWKQILLEGDVSEWTPLGTISITSSLVAVVVVVVT